LRLGEWGGRLANGTGIWGVGGDGWRAASSHLRIKIRSRATHPAAELKWRCSLTVSWRLKSATNSAQRHRKSQDTA
ncbi:hypothetical protein, partial [Achromobacter insolitus]|uniref:hypothetical protein n=1 Tax=Achromobacter insolitus TaxID=217204 RepID=UPI001EEEF766